MNGIFVFLCWGVVEGWRGGEKERRVENMRFFFFLDTNLFSDMCVGNISFQSVACLFNDVF